MPTKTPLIRYNVRERHRKHRGVERNFDAATLASIINGPEVQERVAKRDLFGYLGHWVRMDHGMEPPEGAIVGGKLVPLEPAFITTHLQALPDGTIEHVAETMDNANGAAVERYLSSKAGGFSSAIRTTLRGGLDIPVSFHGFDYVKEPNFSANRAYAALDGVDDQDGEFWMFDGVVVTGEVPRAEVATEALAEASRTIEALRALYDGLAGDHARALETLEHVANENADLLGQIVAAKLDSAAPPTLPSRKATPAGPSLADQAAAFKAAPLAALDSVAAADEAKPARRPVVSYLPRRK